MEIHKGDIVTVKAYVFTEYGSYESDTIPSHCLELIHEPKHGKSKDKKCLWKRKGMLFRALITGHTYRATGCYYHGYDSRYGIDGFEIGESPYLSEDKRHKVWYVQPLDAGDRYYIPYTCLEEDLEKENKNE